MRTPDIEDFLARDPKDPQNADLKPFYSEPVCMRLEYLFNEILQTGRFDPLTRRISVGSGDTAGEVAWLEDIPMAGQELWLPYLPSRVIRNTALIKDFGSHNAITSLEGYVFAVNLDNPSLAKVARPVRGIYQASFLSRLIDLNS